MALQGLDLCAPLGFTLLHQPLHQKIDAVLHQIKVSSQLSDLIVGRDRQMGVQISLLHLIHLLPKSFDGRDIMPDHQRRQDHADHQTHRHQHQVLEMSAFKGMENAGGVMAVHQLPLGGADGIVGDESYLLQPSWAERPGVGQQLRLNILREGADLQIVDAGDDLHIPS